MLPKRRLSPQLIRNERSNQRTHPQQKRITKNRPKRPIHTIQPSRQQCTKHSQNLRHGEQQPRGRAFRRGVGQFR